MMQPHAGWTCLLCDDRCIEHSLLKIGGIVWPDRILHSVDGDLCACDLHSQRIQSMKPWTGLGQATWDESRGI